MSTPTATKITPSRRLFWGGLWLAILLTSIKAYHLGLSARVAWTDLPNYIGSLAAISYVDVLFAVVLAGAGRVLVAGLGHRRRAAVAVSVGFSAVAAFCVVYSVANMRLFGVFGGFLTYPILALVGSVRMLESSVSAHLTTPVVLVLTLCPVTYVLLVEASLRLVPARTSASSPRRGIAMASLGMWMAIGQYGFSTEWATRQDRRVTENPQWVMLASWWQAMNGGLTVRMTDHFNPSDLDDFEPLGARHPSAAELLHRMTPRATRRALASRPPNVIVIVLESVAARWTGLGHGPYESTPRLNAESHRALVFDSFYAHIGRSSNSLAAILLSAYPKLDFRDVTEQYPRLPGTSLASLFHDRGYRTAFITPSELSWAGWRQFLENRGFGELHDRHDLSCTELVSSWGVEDRCMVDGMIRFIDQAPTRPFFLMGWTTQTHHPYEPTPGMPLVDMRHEPVPDQYNLGRYLNVLRETDRQLERLFEYVRRRQLDQDTLIVIVGDHGQAFGYPHDTYIQGRTIYQEDVNVPLMVWFPRRYPAPAQSPVVGGHVDLAPTIAELAGLPTAPDWQGRSLFDTSRSGRAYFYVAEDRFTLGVREGRWKYIYDLRQGVHELYDLTQDPDEQKNVAAEHDDICTRLRQHLAAWTEANRRQYSRTATGS